MNSVNTVKEVIERKRTCVVRCVGSVQWSLQNGELKKWLMYTSSDVPLYQPRGPSVLNVFHRQSIGFLYKRPTCLPSGMTFVGWLYIRVKACSSCQDHLPRHVCTNLVTYSIRRLHNNKLKSLSFPCIDAIRNSTYHTHARH